MKLSLVLPVYNEETNIQKGVLDKIGNYTASNPDIIEVILVDDGSNDESRSVIKSKYLPEFKKFKLIENKHHGKAFAVITGIKKAVGEYVMFSDIDLATPIEELEKLIQQASGGYEIVIGSRDNQRQGAPFLRQLMAKGFIYIRDFLISLDGIHDTQCGFKLFNRGAALKIIDRLHVFKLERDVSGSSVSAGFDLEFLFMASRLGFKIKEVPVEWRHVETKNVNFLRDSVETMKDIMTIKYYDLAGKYTKWS